ncbi:MAG TPA: DUF4142 domain-containing protein [Micromonosporaceae bacterium]|nr:DUF4142 domain-containing protein [Micromonosporaceae bacterium]
MRAVSRDEDLAHAGASSGGAASRPMRRSLVALGVTAVALAITATLVRGLMGGDTPANAATAEAEGTVATKWGPLTAVERDLVVRVRLAGLWEAPTGEQAQQRAASPVVKDVGRKLMVEHGQLDEAVRAVAAQLGMGLPNEPNADQKAWMAELGQLEGTAYDNRFVELLRVAHGKVYKILASVRSTTANSLVRTLATTGSTFVQRHMSYLESTGLTNWNQVAAAVEAPPPPVRKVSDSGWPIRYADKIILVALLLAGAVNFMIFRRSRRRWAALA